MTVLISQWLNGAFMLALGVTAVWSVSLLHSAPAIHQSTWRIAAGAFLLTGASNFIQSSAAVWAYISGPGSSVYSAYILYGIRLNTGRSLVEILFGMILIYWIFRDTGRSKPPGWIYAALAASLILGGSIGPGDPIHSTVYFPMIAALSFVELVVLGFALVLALLRKAMDRLLWLILATFVFAQAVSIGILSAFSWLDVPQVWAPGIQQFALFNTVVALVMTLLAIHRFHLARKGVQVPTLFGQLESTRRSSVA
ncbi:hypothetical protein BH23GEM3_BH23GEM3_03230 [soil metagenome]|nr:hypothetical protein [Gemmatimonadota bacterium]